MADLKKITDLKISRLEKVPGDFTMRVGKAQYGIFAEIQALIDKLERKGDYFVMSKKNLLVVSELDIKIRDILYKSDYAKEVKNFIGEFTKQAALTADYFKQEFQQQIKVSDTTNQLLKNAQKSSLQKLVGDGLTTNFITPAKDILDKAVSSGAGWKETVKRVQDFAIGTGDGKLLRYSKGISYDLFAVADRTYTNSISLDNGFVWYVYSGDVILDSREFCKEHSNKYYHQKEIEDWASKDWAGKHIDTNSSTIFNLAGGYGCKHSILPVSLFSVPKDVVKRNISNGNFVPNEKEKKELGLA